MNGTAILTNVGGTFMSATIHRSMAYLILYESSKQTGSCGSQLLSCLEIN